MAPVIFLSYADVKDLDGTVTAFHTALDKAIKERFNMNAKVFIDKNIRIGDKWENDLSNELSDSTVLLILLSPVWLSREWCRAEYNIFKSAHGGDQNKGIIIPLLWIDTEMRNAENEESKTILKELKAIEMVDWREMKNNNSYRDSEKLRSAISKLADDITDKIWKISE